MRFLLLAALVFLALLIYALVDVSNTDSKRIRALPKVGWICAIVLLPAIGPIMWLTIGKNRGPLPDTGADYGNTGGAVSAAEEARRLQRQKESDAVIAELEARLRELEQENFGPPAEDPDSPREQK